MTNFFKALDENLMGDPVLVAGPATVNDIENIEEFFGFSLPPEYRAFVAKYGAAVVGPYSVYGVGAAEAMGTDEDSVIRVTERFRADGWPGTEGTLVIPMDLAGNAITLDADGQVCRFDHDTGTSEQVSASFGEFILRCLSN